MVLWHTIESVGVGFPNPSGEETKPYDGCHVLNFGALAHLAPEERYVLFVSITD